MRTEQWLILAVIWIADFAVFMVVFAVGRNLAESGSDSMVLGLAGGGFSLALGMSSLLGGRISDKVGRVRVILTGLVGMAMCTAGCLVLGAEHPFYIPMYTLVAAATGMVYPPSIALLNRGQDAVTRGGIGRMIVFFCLAWNGGLISGQLTGGWLFHYDPVRPIQAAMVLTLINPFLLWLAVINQASLPTIPDQNTTPHLKHRANSAMFSRLAWTANLGGAFAMSMVFHLLPLWMVELEIPAREHGRLLAMNRGVVVLTYLLMYRVQFWHHRFFTAALSQILAAGCLLVLAAADSRLGLVVGLIGLAQLLGYNYFASLYYSTTGVTEEQRGAASGMHEFTLSVGFAAGATVGGFVGQLAGSRAPYQLAAAVILVLLVVQVTTLARIARRG